MSEETGWLIEYRTAEGSGTYFFCAEPGSSSSWHLSPDRACRFARQSDATGMMRWLDHNGLPPVDRQYVSAHISVAEHIWIGS